MLGVSVVLAVRRALRASREQAGLQGWWKLGRRNNVTSASIEALDTYTSKERERERAYC